jgi:NAD(P)-dependent dehydrogenase (short-subunit alcohol dehydrogenase family)
MGARIQLQGATALVTGAGSGIGRATAIALARKGADVLCVDLDESTAKTTADACRDHGVESVAYTCDVADAAAMADLADQVGREHGALGVLVNNAGVGMSGGFADMTLDDWEWIRSFNLDGVVHGCNAFGPAMLAEGRGHIVNMSSGLAYLLHSTEVAYCTTKAAVLAFSRCLRSDWKHQGVSVSAVCPGVINTPILESTRFIGQMGTQQAKGLAQRAFNRGHSPEVVATAVLTAIEHDRAVVPAGAEARIGWHLAKVMPVAVADLLGRPAPSWLTRGRGR